MATTACPPSRLWILFQPWLCHNGTWWLDDCKITDAGLPYLTELSALRQVWLRRTAVSESAVKDLQQALPKLQIIR